MTECPTSLRKSKYRREDLARQLPLFCVPDEGNRSVEPLRNKVGRVAVLRAPWV